jgi:ATP dependent DNA ligase domain
VKSRSVTPPDLPDFVDSMKAKLIGSMPSGGDWIYEIKFDGYRALALRDGSETRLLSRNQKDLDGKFPEVKDSVAALDLQDAMIDGEIVALEEKGRWSFQLLQNLDMGRVRAPIVFYAFDLLRLNGKDPSRFTDRRTKEKAGRTAEKAAGCNQIFGLFHESVEYNPAARAKPPRLVRESSRTPVFEAPECRYRRVVMEGFFSERICFASEPPRSEPARSLKVSDIPELLDRAGKLGLEGLIGKRVNAAVLAMSPGSGPESGSRLSSITSKNSSSADSPSRKGLENTLVRCLLASTKART